MAKTAKPKKRLTNVQFVREIMEYSQFGAMAQVFVLDAISKLAEAVADSKPSDYSEKSIVAPDAWIGVANEIRAKLAAHYNK